MEGQLGLILAAILSVLVLVVLGWFLFRQQNPAKSKKTQDRNSGTDTAVAALRGFARSNGFRFIAPATVQSGEKTAGLNAVVVGYFGIIGLKAMGYNGEIYGEAGAAEWLQVGPSGARTHFANPVTEASADVRVLRDVLLNAGLKRVPIEVVNVFTAAGVQLALPRSVEVYRMKDFKALLKKEKYLEDCGLDLDAVEKAVKDAVA